MQGAFRERLSSVSDMQEIIDQKKAKDGSRYIEQSDMLLQLTKIIIRKISMGAVYFTTIENDSKSQKNRYFMHNGFSFSQADIGNEFYVSNVNPNLLVKKVNPFDYDMKKKNSKTMHHLGKVRVLMTSVNVKETTFVYNDRGYKIKTPNCWEWVTIPVGHFFDIMTKMTSYKDEDKVTIRLRSGECQEIVPMYKAVEKETKIDVIKRSILLASNILSDDKQIDFNLSVLSKFSEQDIEFVFRDMVKTRELSKDEEDNFMSSEVQNKLKGLRTRPAEAEKDNTFKLVLEK